MSDTTVLKFKLPFAGDKEEWPAWNLKFQSIDKKKGQIDILDEVITPTKTADGKQDRSDGDDKKDTWEKVDDIYCFLVLNLTDEALDVVEANEDTPE